MAAFDQLIKFMIQAGGKVSRRSRSFRKENLLLSLFFLSGLNFRFPLGLKSSLQIFFCFFLFCWHVELIGASSTRASRFAWVTQLRSGAAGGKWISSPVARVRSSHDARQTKNIMKKKTQFLKLKKIFATTLLLLMLLAPRKRALVQSVCSCAALLFFFFFFFQLFDAIHRLFGNRDDERKD